MINILFDHQIFSLQKLGGISRYFCSLIENLKKLDGVECNISSVISDNSYYSKFARLRTLWPLSLGFDRKRVLVAINNTFSRLQLRHSSFDIFHPTYYSPYFLKDLNEKPFVITICDLIDIASDEVGDINRKENKFKQQLALKATKIIAISQNTKRDIIQHYKISSDKIDVIYLGNPFEKYQKQKSGYTLSISLPAKYMLFVGNRSGYKNFERFILAISGLLRKDMNLYLVCCGGGRFTPNEIASFTSLSIQDKIFQYSVTDEMLFSIYAKAVCFVFPSSYEGFGLPIIEAFSAGCPVALSTTSCFPEIAEDAACYFDPRNIDSMRSTIEEVIHDKRKAELLSKKGSARAQCFSWGNTASKTLQLYRELVL